MRKQNPQSSKFEFLAFAKRDSLQIMKDQWLNNEFELKHFVIRFSKTKHHFQKSKIIWISTNKTGEVVGEKKLGSEISSEAIEDFNALRKKLKKVLKSRARPWRPLNLPWGYPSSKLNDVLKFLLNKHSEWAH